MAIIVLGGNVSPYVRKVRAYCAEKDIDYTLKPINPFDPPEGWHELSPLGKIPALDHDGRIINDSSVICAYLERLHPEPALYPAAAYDCARAQWIEEFVDSGLIPVGGPKIFQPVVLRPLMAGKDPEPEAIAAATQVFEEQQTHFEYLERELGDREFFVGGELTVADIIVASVFVNLRHAGFPPLPERTPALAAFVERMHARASFAALIEEERPIFGKRWV